MSILTDLIVVFIVIMNVLLTASGRISGCIKLVAAQGFIVGILPLMDRHHDAWVNTIVFAVASIALKSFVFPWLLFRAQREANIQREVEPLIGYPVSMMLCVVAFMISYWLGLRLPLPGPVFSKWIVPVSFSTILTGFLIIISRTKALTQVLGYLVMENGIYIFGSALLVGQPLLVELAILLDVFVAVFVMGIAIFHISREFDHINTKHLSQLKDWAGSGSEQELLK